MLITITKPLLAPCVGTAQLCVVRRTIRCLFIFCGWQHPNIPPVEAGHWTGRGCTNPEIRRWPLGGNELMVSTYSIYTISIQYLHSIYTVSTENVRPLHYGAAPRPGHTANIIIWLSYRHRSTQTRHCTGWMHPRASLHLHGVSAPLEVANQSHRELLVTDGNVAKITKHKPVNVVTRSMFPAVSPGSRIYERW